LALLSPGSGKHFTILERTVVEWDLLEDITTIVNIVYLNARAMMEVGSSVRTTIEESLKICSGSSVSSRCGTFWGQKPDRALRKEWRS
jgi:hypothetical protein